MLVARLTNFRYDRPLPRPACQIFRRSAAARTIIFSNVSARPGPAYHVAARPMKHGLYMGRPDNCVGRPVALTGRPMVQPMCCSVPKRSCTHYADVKF